MGDLGAVVMAAACAAGALAARPAPLLVALATLGCGWVSGRTAIVVGALFLLTSGGAARAAAGLHPPVTGGFAGVVTLVDDPANVGGAQRVDVRIHGKRVEAWCRGRSAARVRDLLAGERVWMAGRVDAVPATRRSRVAPRHIAGRIAVRAVGVARQGSWPTVVANAVRRRLVRGVASLARSRRALFTGFVLGDDRDQAPEVVADFQGSGLAHLLVVSGENVAFVLALARPMLSRTALLTRAVAGVAILAGFGLLVRWEPSVLRAEAMAALALFSGVVGRPATRVRLLSLAVAAVLAVDPLLVRSPGFVMSVGACAGIAVLAPRLARALPGPRPIADALAVTAAAQVGVAPVLVPLFGGVPLASLPANLLAAPAAGPIMMWGMAAGLPAGLLGGTVARAIHAPTAVLLWWVATVARVAAAAPLGTAGGITVAILAAGGALALALAGAWRVAAAGALLTVLAAGPVGHALRPPACAGRAIAPEVRLWRAQGTTIVVVGSADPARLIDALRGASVRRVDAVVVRAATADAESVLASLRRRVRVARVFVGATTKTGRRLPDGWTLLGAGPVRAGPFVIGPGPPSSGPEVRRAAATFPT